MTTPITRTLLAFLACALALAAAAFAGAPFQYLWDDGASNTNQGPPSTFDPDMLWINYFEVEPGAEVITTVSVAFGPTFDPDRPTTFWLFEDPNDDFDPTDGVPLASVTTVPGVLGGNVFNHVEIPPTQVSGGFFVGVSAFLFGGEDRPAAVDTNARADRSWFFYAPDIKTIANDLGSAPFFTRMDDTQFVIFPGAFLIRATGIPAPNCPGDLDGDGAVSAADLALVLGAWGTANPAADLDGSGDVGAGDLALLLGAWGPCP